jgi:CheY-like chemotaxis protein
VSTEKRTILCIDDYEAGLSARKILLEDEGYEVLTATDGRSGLQLFESHRVDGVILDYQMPGMNGDLVACQMKQLKPRVPILLLSAYISLPEEKLRFFDALVAKDEPLRVFSAAVRELMSKASAFSSWIGNWQARLTDLNLHREPVKQRSIQEQGCHDGK